MFHKWDFPDHLNTPQSPAISFSSYQINMEMRKFPHGVRGDPTVYMNFVKGLKCPAKCSNALVSPKRNLWAPKGTSSSREGPAGSVCARGNFQPAIFHIPTCPGTPEHLRYGEPTALQRGCQTHPRSACLIYLLFLVHINLHMFYSHLI